MSDAIAQSVIRNVVIIGSGPAGYTAAIYAGRANLSPLVFEGFQKGGIPGGQLMTTTEVENFPGFPNGIMGPQLLMHMKEQALNCGAELVMEDVVAVDFSDRPFTITSSSQSIQAHSVIIATGATAKFRLVRYVMDSSIAIKRLRLYAQVIQRLRKQVI